MAIVFLFLFITTTLSKEYNSFFNLNELKHPKFSNGRFHKQYFHQEDERGGFIHFEYDVEHTEDGVILLEEIPSIASIQCNSSHLTLYLLSKSPVEEFQIGKLVTGGRKWDCKNQKGLSSAILRKINNITFVSREFIVLETNEASYLDVFKNAQISFQTNIFPQDHFKEIPTSVLDEEIAKKTIKKRGIWEFLQSVWGSVNTLVDTVEALVSAVPTLIGILSGQDYTFSGNFLHKDFSWNLDQKINRSRGPIKLSTGLSCSNCYAHIGFTVEFALSISDRTLQNYTIVLHGDAELAVAGDLFTEISYSDSGSWVVGTVHMDPIDFFIGGIPFFISMTVPIKIGYEVSVVANTKMAVDINAQGLIRYGITCNQRNCQSINEQFLNKSGNFGDLKQDASATVIIYILPTLVVNVDRIGGPYFAFKPYLEAVVQYDPTGQCINGLQAALNYGLQISVGAQIDISFFDIEIFKHKFNATTIYSVKKPIDSGCVEFSNLGFNFYQDQFLFEGDVWAGYQEVDKTQCPDVPEGDAVVQLVLIEEGEYYFVSNFNMIMDDDSICILQAFYQGFIDNNEILFEPAEDEYGNVGYYYCQNPDYSLSMNSFGGIFEEDNNVIVLDLEQCVSLTLVRGY